MKNITNTQHSWSTNLKFTNHFIERYNERILRWDNSFSNAIEYINDINGRLSNREKNIIIFFKNSKKVIVPMKTHCIVIKNNVLITIY